MAYCLLADMEKLLPATMLINLSTDVSGATVADATNISESIDQADREIDAYLRIANYSVPMSPVPPLIANLSAKMAIWNLHLRKYFDSPIWRETYKDCLKLLERIAEGKLTLGQEVEGVTQEGVGGHAVSTRAQKFTESFMETF
jgi:phage gp36-like protein